MEALSRQLNVIRIVLTYSTRHAMVIALTSEPTAYSRHQHRSERNRPIDN